MAHAQAHGTEGPHAHHIIPQSTLIRVFAGLIVLTVVTVLTSRLDLGMFNVPLALAIAIGKASLVVTFFMALKYDKRVNVLVFVVGTLFVVVFLTFTLFDMMFRGDLGNVSKLTIMDLQRQEEAALSNQSPGVPGVGSPMPAGAPAGAVPADSPGDSTAGAPADTSAAADSTQH